MADKSASPAPLGDAENKAIITHSEEKSNAPSEFFNFFKKRQRSLKPQPCKCRLRKLLALSLTV